MKNNQRAVTDLAAMSWTEFDLHCSRTSLVVIPCGAVEVYGPHLPLGSDGYVARAIAGLVADELAAFCTPLVPIGNSADLMSFPGTLTVEPKAFVSYLEGICQSLLCWGLDQFLFLNTHLGNVTLIDEIASSLVRQGLARCMQVDYWRFAARCCSDLLTTEWAAGHGGELGTAVMLYLVGWLVNMEAAEDFVPDENPWPSGLSCYNPYREVTPTGVLGVPTAATVEKGKAIVQRCVDTIVEEAETYFGQT